jgi:hypothetical protein
MIKKGSAIYETKRGSAIYETKKGSAIYETKKVALFMRHPVFSHQSNKLICFIRQHENEADLNSALERLARSLPVVAEASHLLLADHRRRSNERDHDAGEEEHRRKDVFHLTLPHVLLVVAVRVWRHDVLPELDGQKRLFVLERRSLKGIFSAAIVLLVERRLVRLDADGVEGAPLNLSLVKRALF